MRDAPFHLVAKAVLENMLSETFQAADMWAKPAKLCRPEYIKCTTPYLAYLSPSARRETVNLWTEKADQATTQTHWLPIHCSRLRVYGMHAKER